MPLRVSFFDVGDCHSTLCEFADGTSLLVDCGAGNRATADYLVHLSTITDVVITHPHADHMRSLARIEARIGRFFSIRTRPFLEPGSAQEKHDLEAYGALRRRPGSGSLTKEIVLKNDVAGSIEVLAPLAPPAFAATPSEMDDASAIVQVFYKGRSFLITGDNAETSLRLFTANWRPRRVDVLLAPHHGGLRGFWSEFVAHVSPSWVVIGTGSVKVCDAFDHYVQRARAGVRVTREHGTITFTVDAKGRFDTNAP